MTQMPVKAVLFDLDDTLVDRESAYNHVYRVFYDTQSAVNEETSWEEAKEFFWSLSPFNATNPRLAILDIKNRWPGVESDPETHHRFYFDRLLEGMKILPHVMELLDDLNDAGCPWGVVTNGNELQYRKISAVGLQDKTPFVLASHIFGADKPDPSIYHEAMKLLDVPDLPCSQVMFAGDNPYTDIAGAHGVGMRTAWVHMRREYPGDAPRPDLTISGVHELRDLLGV